MRKLDFQRGSATVEFIGWTAIIVIPLVYFIIYLSYLQATALALESAVQAAGQVAMHARTPEQVSQAYTAAQLALDDQDVQADARQAMHISCLSPGCGDGRVSISISAKVALPGIGRAGQGLAPVSLSATRQVQLADTRGWKGAK